MLSDEKIIEALELGAAQAEQIAQERQAILANRPKLGAPLAGINLQPAMHNFNLVNTYANKFGVPSSSVLIAEGDSWFDYPGKDILSILDDTYGFDIESSAHGGDNIENMAYDEQQKKEFSKRLEKVLRNYSTPPKAILLSGGGNDLAGDEFKMLLNHRASPSSGLSEKMIDVVINERIKTAYITIIQRVTSSCIKYIGKSVPIIIHGYDYPVPDGRGFMSGWGPLPGPWFSPSFNVKDFNDIHARINITNRLIDIFNEMLATLPLIAGFNHVHYIDLRNTLCSVIANNEYKNDWANELHPESKGFLKITEKIYGVISNV